MKSVLLSIALIVSSSAAALADDPVKGFADSMLRAQEQQANAEMRAFCAERWPEDFVMQDFCHQESTAAYARAQAYDLINGPPEMMVIWSKCTSQWTDAKGRLDWTMVDFCLSEQVKALGAVKARQATPD